MSALPQSIKPGTRFGKLTIIKFSRTINYRSAFWCRCDCGTLKEIKAEKLKGGITRSCGCLKIESNRKMQPSTDAVGLLNIKPPMPVTIKPESGLPKAATPMKMLPIFSGRKVFCAFIAKNLWNHIMWIIKYLSAEGDQMQKEIFVFRVPHVI